MLIFHDLQTLLLLWKFYNNPRGLSFVPEDLVSWMELVLNDKGDLLEIKRNLGENDVSDRATSLGPKDTACARLDCCRTRHKLHQHYPALSGWLALLLTNAGDVESNTGPTWGRQQQPQLSII